MIELNNKTILIIGATGGIGKEIVKQCLNLGAEVFALGRSIEKLDDFKENEKLTILCCDLTNKEEVYQTLNKINCLDGIVHAAGIVYPYPIKFIKEKHFNEVFSINTESIITFTSTILYRKLLNNNASVIFISSISVNHPYMGGGLYVASKAALEAFSKTLALEYAMQGIRSNAIAPALIETEIYDQTKNAYSDEQWSKIVSQYPLGIGQPKDVAYLTVFLLSNLSSWITGTTITMDGGLLLSSNR